MDSLDGIVTAVSELLLVFEEAQKDFSTNLKVESKNLSTLIHSIQQMINDNKGLIPQIEDQQLRSKMNQTFVDTTEASDRLENLIKAQPNGIIARSAYRQMHEELRVILHNMILQIQITDQCNVKILMTSAKKNLDCVSRLAKVDTAGGLDAVARDLKKLQDAFDIYLRTRIAETTDSDLNSRLTNAAERYMSSTPRAVDATRQNIESASAANKSAKESALRTVVEALQDIINTVIQTAEFINQFALQFALPPAQRRPDEAGQRPRVDEELTRLEKAVRRGDAKEANAALQGLDREVAKQAEEGRAIANKIDDAKEKKDLLDEITKLERLVPQINEATQNVLAHPDDKRAQDKFANLVSQARQANQNIENAKKPEHRLLENGRGLEAAMKKLRDAVDKGDRAAADAALKEAMDRIAKQVAHARAMAQHMKDPVQKKIVLDAADELERLAPQLAQALRQTMDDPNNKELRKKFDDISKRVTDENDKITRAVLEDQLSSNNKDLKNKIDDLYDAVAKGDANKAEKLNREIEDLVKRRTELGRELAKHVTDPKLKNQILGACDILEKDVPELASATQNALKNPNDPKATERLYRVGEEMKEMANRVTATKLYTSDKLPEAVIANGATLDQSLNNLLDAIRRGDAAAAAAAARDVANQIAKQVALGRQLAEQCHDDPALRKKILDACDELERLSPLIVQATRDAIMNPDDKEAQKRLEGLVAQAKTANKVITDAAEIIKNRRDNKNKPAPVKAATKQQHSETRADGSKDEIMIAAHQVDKALREVSSPVIAEQKDLLDIARMIAEEMERLSLAAQSDNKKDMITSARKIAEMITKVQSLSIKIGEKCQDEKLKARLLNICKVPKNFAVQLKIISAVKAASGDNDKAAEAQLVTCAKGLASAVVETVKAADAASLKCK